MLRSLANAPPKRTLPPAGGPSLALLFMHSSMARSGGFFRSHRSRSFHKSAMFRIVCAHRGLWYGVSYSGSIGTRL